MSQDHSETTEETWSKFEDNLIDFIKANPILTTNLFNCQDVARAKELWEEFSEKWNYSVRNCKISWTTIKTMHLKTKRGEYENSPTYKKYMDDRLSFLDNLDNKTCSTTIGTTLNLNTKNVRACCSIDKEDNNIVSKPNKKKKETTEIDSNLDNNIVSKPKKKKKETDEIYSNTSPGDCENEKQQSLSRSLNLPVTVGNEVDIGKADSETFTDFEKKLIDYVKDYPILYDSRSFFSNVGGSARRIQVGLLWDKFYAECGTNGYICHKRWDSIRMTYFRVRKLQDETIALMCKFQDETVALKSSDLKYLDGRFDFLEPMYKYIKTNSINVFSDKTHTIEDDNYTPPTLNASKSRHYLWSEFDPLGADFDRRLVDFVKKHRVLYDPSAILLEADSRVVVNRLWREVGVLLSSSGIDCCFRWRQIKNKYVKYLEKKRILPRNKQFQQMSFYDAVYFENNDKNPVVHENTEDFTPSYDEELITIEPKEETKICYKVYGRKNDKTPVIKNLVHEDTEDTTQSNDEELLTVIPKEEINIYDSLIEFQDGPLEENVKPNQYYEEPQPSTSINTDSFNSKDSNASTVVSNMNNEKCDSKGYKRRVHLSESGSSDCESTYNEVNAEPKNVLTLLSQQELSNSDFFREIGRFVSDRFPEAKQKEIRNKSLALVTELELAMLEED